MSWLVARFLIADAEIVLPEPSLNERVGGGAASPTTGRGTHGVGGTADARPAPPPLGCRDLVTNVRTVVARSSASGGGDHEPLRG